MTWPADDFLAIVVEGDGVVVVGRIAGNTLSPGAKRNSQTAINTCLDDMFLYVGFTASGRGEHRSFAGYGNMLPFYDVSTNELVQQRYKQAMED
jgi:hypothetical protein